MMPIEPVSGSDDKSRTFPSSSILYCFAGYLGNSHRHLFYVEAQVEVKHDDREIEFHDLLDFCKSHFFSGEMGPLSCEMLARDLRQQIVTAYPGRKVIVSVFEDNEVGAIVDD